ncbi:hypothetical protein DS901_18455 [Loktanella sp. D2R18]|nr:hypothetical protein DS901_18455 [Loktanella sp. D2R18]
MSRKDVLTCAVLVLALYAGGNAAYILGIVLGLPAPIATLINHASIVHLSGQLTFMALIIFALFKITRLIIVGLVFQWIFMICKFRYGPKKPRGLRGPTLVRLQRRMLNAVVEGRSYGRVVFGGRIIAVLAFCLSTFFSIANEEFTTQLISLSVVYTILFGGFIAITGSMSAYQVATSRTHREFINSAEGRKLAVVTTLFLCMLLGMARTFTMIHGPTLSYSFGNEVCHFAPMMPVYGGNLYFDHESSSFVVLSSNKIVFYMPHRTSQKPPACI